VEFVVVHRHSGGGASLRSRPRTVAGAALALLVAVAAATPVQAWSFNVHRFIAARAIDAMPPALKPYYKKYRAQIVEHAIDPDLWRNAGWEEEPPRHFLDLDAYGPYPFDALPHDHAEAVKKFGQAMVTKNGVLPWRTAEIYGKLVEAFTNLKNGRPYAYENIKFFTSVLAHYVSDAHVPFHAIENYDGQLTNQHGIHARFETELFERYRKKLKIVVPREAVTVGPPRELIFRVLTDSAKLTGPILEADRTAIGTGEVYDQGYFDRFFAATRPTLEQRISASIAVVVATVTQAWEEAGRPALPLEAPRRDQRKRTAAPAPAL
jgi:hypothetical protein